MVVPGIGAIHGFCASSQAIANWAEVTFLAWATALSESTSDMFRVRASPVKRGLELRKSVASNWVSLVTAPARKPRPSGL